MVFSSLELLLYFSILKMGFIYIYILILYIVLIYMYIYEKKSK
jgi:hypothetical protein